MNQNKVNDINAIVIITMKLISIYALKLPAIIMFLSLCVYIFESYNFQTNEMRIETLHFLLIFVCVLFALFTIDLGRMNVALFAFRNDAFYFSKWLQSMIKMRCNICVYRWIGWGNLKLRFKNTWIAAIDVNSYI